MDTITIPPGGRHIIDLHLRQRTISEEDARALTEEIQQTSVRLWLLVTEAHDRRAHLALGYATWEDYSRAELKMSPSRSYQLLDTGHVMKAMARAGADLDALPTPTARVVARVKNRLPEVQKVARTALRDGLDPDDALRELARQPTPGATVGTAPVAPAPREESGGAASKPAGPDRVVCPVCVGEGRVSKTMARRAQAWLRKK